MINVSQPVLWHCQVKFCCGDKTNFVVRHTTAERAVDFILDGITNTDVHEVHCVRIELPEEGIAFAELSASVRQCHETHSLYFTGKVCA